MASIFASRQFLFIGRTRTGRPLPAGMQRPIEDCVKLIIPMNWIGNFYAHIGARRPELPPGSRSGARQDVIVPPLFVLEIPRDRPPSDDSVVVHAPLVRGLRVKAKPMNSVQIAEALLNLEGAAGLAELFSARRKCDAVPVQFVMLRMFPDTSYDDLAAGLQLAVTLARLDEAEAEAEAEAMAEWRPR